MPTGTTATPQNHMKRHPLLMEEYKKDAANMPSKSEPALDDILQQRKQPLSLKKENSVHDKVAEVVPLDLHPYSFVEDRGLKALIKKALPSSSAISKKIVARARPAPVRRHESKGMVRAAKGT